MEPYLRYSSTQFGILLEWNQTVNKASKKSILNDSEGNFVRLKLSRLRLHRLRLLAEAPWAKAF